MAGTAIPLHLMSITIPPRLSLQTSHLLQFMSYSTWSPSCVMAPMYNNNIYFVVYNKYTKTPKSYMYALLPPLLPCVKVTEEFHIIRGWGVLICVLIIKTDKTQTWVQTGMRCCVRFPAKHEMYVQSRLRPRGGDLVQQN